MGAFPSVCHGCEKEFDKNLNKKIPPPEFTRILKKGDFWTWKTRINFRMPATGKTYYNNWETISKLKTRATVVFSMFPANSQIGKRIKERWKKFGILFFSGTHSTITSEPFEIDLRNLVVQK
jgi:hypothetical protein